MRRQLKCCLDLLHPNVDSIVRNKQEKQQWQFDKNVPVCQFIIGNKFGKTFKCLRKMIQNGILELL